MADTPFAGFPREGLTFLADLAENNDRDWFKPRKDTYTRLLVEPAQDFISALGRRLKSISEGIRYDTAANGRGSLMRVYRDIRFSKDKSPYKTNVGIIFWEGEGAKTERPGYYVHITPGGATVMAGQHHFAKGMLEAYRQAVVDKGLGAEMVEVLQEIAAAGDYAIGGAHYKRVPRGYPADHPRAEMLKYNALWASAPHISPDVLCSPAIVDVAFEQCLALASLHRWLVRVAATASP